MASVPNTLAGKTPWQVDTLLPNGVVRGESVMDRAGSEPSAFNRPAGNQLIGNQVIGDQLVGNQTAGDQATGDQPALWRSADGERTYTVQVVSPFGTRADTCLPLLFALDGELVLAALQALPACPVRVVAISHDGERKPGRAFDYTPPIAQRGVLHDPRVPAWRAGGADAFLAFITDTLQPAVANAFAVDPDCQVLYGHSYGGLFVLHALSKRPQAFSSYVAASPALWWFELQAARPIQLVEALAAQTLAHKVDVVVTAGGQEAWHPVATGTDGTPASRSGGVPTLPAARGLAALLANVPGVHARFHDFPQATHHTMLAESARFALDFATHAVASRRACASPLSR